jgi:hypothetical protein
LRGLIASPLLLIGGCVLARQLKLLVILEGGPG